MWRECWRSVACVFSAVPHTPVSRAASCVEGEGGCQCLCLAEAVVYLFAPGSRRAFAHSSNNKHWWLLTKAMVPASPNSGDLEVPGGLLMYPCPWHRDHICKYSRFGPCIHTHCNIKLHAWSLICVWWSETPLCPICTQMNHMGHPTVEKTLTQGVYLIIEP